MIWIFVNPEEWLLEIIREALQGVLEIVREVLQWELEIIP